ncbi:MAG: hydantoinase B/oxoprolinase family protein, partial [Gammaproteobacteria bacterium]
AYAMTDLVNQFDWAEGDTLVINDPYLGGTHLPDVTLISPVFFQDELAGFVANRAHHADIGSESPGSMPISTTQEEEGMVIAPQFLARRGEILQPVWDELDTRLGSQSDTQGDFLAQMAANQKGALRLTDLIASMGMAGFFAGLAQLNRYAEQLARTFYADIPDGVYVVQDFMDDDGQGEEHIAIKLQMRVSGSDIELDFTGTHAQVQGNINCPLSVAAAAAYYVFRCLLPDYTPACDGIFVPVRLKAPLGTLVNAERPHAVAAGNVETSSRLVDLVMAALRQALPGKMAADSQGTMNNIAMGARNNIVIGARNNIAMGARNNIAMKGSGENTWSYYETLGGGMGAHAHGAGLSGVQSHMTNTLNTPIEVLETRFPLRIREYSLRQNSGGAGQYPGGNGLVREYEFLQPAEVTLLTERRVYAPKGDQGGGDGRPGRNLLNGKLLVPKVQLSVNTGDRLRIETPGGGGYGNGPGS